MISMRRLQKPTKLSEIVSSAREEAVGKWEYKTYSTIGEALTGADFVVISILPGTFDEMAVDVHMPERLGIWQSVGDTAGPGGIIRALRTIPMYVTIAEAIRDYAPKAWVMNYTNPMSLCVKTLYHVFPKLKHLAAATKYRNSEGSARNRRGSLRTERYSQTGHLRKRTWYQPLYLV